MDIDLPELIFLFSPDFIPFLKICDGVPVNMHSLTLLVSGEWFRTGIKNSPHFGQSRAQSSPAPQSAVGRRTMGSRLHFGRAHTLPNDWFVVD